MHLDCYGLNRIFNFCCFPLICKLGSFRFDFHLLFIYYKSKKLRGRVSTGEAVDTLFSIPNKVLIRVYGQTDRLVHVRTNERTNKRMDIRQRRTDGQLSV